MTTRHDATPSEATTLAEIELAKKNGIDPFGDDELEGDTTTTAVTSDADDTSTDADAAAGDADATDATDTTETTAQELESLREEGTSERPAYVAEVPSDYQAQRTALMTEKAQAMKQLMDGELDVDGFAAIESRVSGALEDLMAQRIRAETLIEANTQTHQATQQQEIRRLIQRSKAEVDYLGDPKAIKQFDMALQMVRADPDNAALDYAALVDLSHRAVLALRGVAAKEPAAAAPRTPDGKPPVTLRGLPVAATPNANGDAIEQMSRLTGPAYEQAYAKLSPAQKARLLDED
jgi:hypothetical protein